MKTFAKLTALLLLAALPGLAAPPKAPKAPTWTTFTAPGNARFSVQFPGKPQTSTQQDQSPVGPVSTSIFTCSTSYGSFSVTFSDLPSIAATFAQGKCFDGARDGLLQDAKATLVSYTDWQHGNDDAKDLVYKSATLNGHAWLIMVGSRLYVADSRVKVGTPSAWVDPFLKSLTYQPAP